MDQTKHFLISQFLASPGVAVVTVNANPGICCILMCSKPAPDSHGLHSRGTNQIPPDCSQNEPPWMINDPSSHQATNLFWLWAIRSCLSNGEMISWLYSKRQSLRHLRYHQTRCSQKCPRPAQRFGTSFISFPGNDAGGVEIWAVVDERFHDLAAGCARPKANDTRKSICKPPSRNVYELY